MYLFMLRRMVSRRFGIAPGLTVSHSHSSRIPVPLRAMSAPYPQTVPRLRQKNLSAKARSTRAARWRRCCEPGPCR